MGHVGARVHRLAVPAVLTVVCVLSLVGAAAATAGTTTPQIVLQRSGHWAVAKAQQRVLHVHGGTQQVDASVALPDGAAQGAVMALQGETQGFVVGRGRAWSFDTSELTSAPSVPLPDTDEQPVGIETVGGPYLVYRGRGTIVRLGLPSAVVEAGGPVGPPVWTSDGTVWVQRPSSGALCAFRRNAVQLDCSARVGAGVSGGLTVIGDRAAFVDVTSGTVALIQAGDQNAGAALGADLPPDTLLADQATPTRLPVVVPATGQLRLLDVTGVADGRAGGSPLDVALGSGTFSAPMVSGDVVAVLELTASTLLTFDGEGHKLDQLRLPPGTDPSNLHRGEDGHIYVDQPDGAGIHVVRADGKITSLGFDLGAGTSGTVAVAASDAQRSLIVPPEAGALTVPRQAPGPLTVAIGPGSRVGGGQVGGGQVGGGPVGGGPIGSGPVGGGPVGGGPVGGNPVGPGQGPSLLPPAPPVAVVAQLTGPAEATVTWQPGTGGGVATGFTVKGSGGIAATTAADRTVFANLTPKTTYTFTVTATNSAGGSAASAPSNPVTSISAAAAPGAFIAERSGCNPDCLPVTADFTWTAPDLGGGTLVDYVVTGTQSGRVIQTKTVTDTTVQYVAPQDFNPCDSVTFQVRAVTRPPTGGDPVQGQPATHSFQDMQCGVDIRIISAQPTASDTVVVTFDAAASSNTATCSLKFDGVTKWSGPCDHLRDNDNQVETITGLSAGTSYSITASIYGEIQGVQGFGMTTDPVNATTPTA